MFFLNYKGFSTIVILITTFLFSILDGVRELLGTLTTHWGQWLAYIVFVGTGLELIKYIFRYAARCVSYRAFKKGIINKPIPEWVMPSKFQRLFEEQKKLLSYQEAIISAQNDQIEELKDIARTYLLEIAELKKMTNG